MEKSPTAARLQLGTELQALYERRSLTTADVAGLLKITSSTVRRYIRGSVTISHGELNYLLDQLGLKNSNARKILFELRDQADQPLWWSKYGLTENMTKLLGFEDAATRIRIFEAHLIPGPFQTEPYARAIIRAKEYRATDDYVEKGVRVRMERQSRVYRRKQPPEVTVVLTEDAIRALIGGPVVMAEALYHLLKMQRELRIIPRGIGAHIGMMGAFYLFDFDPRVRKTAVYVEGPVRNLYTDLEDDVHEATLNFDHLSGLGLSDQQSRAVVMSVIKELEA